MTVEPLYIGPDERPWFAQLHRAADGNGVGLVIVPPFGYEAVCAHRSLRRLARDAAAAGLTAVRIDLDGTGDSAGDDLDPDRVGAWIASIGAACDLARHAGADRIVIAGVRLGVALAARAAAARTDVAGLVAIAPVVSGRKWLREMKALQQAIGLTPAPTPQPADIAEAIGFAITAETQAAIGSIELDKAEARPAPAVLVIDRDDLPPSDKWIARLRAQGAEVDARRLPGYVEMVLDPHKTEVPTEILAATIEWASARPALATPAPASSPRPRTVASIGALREEVAAIETGLAAIVTRPAGPARRAVVLLNAGAVRRIGPNRLYVALARRLAAEGAAVVRVDLSGIGDSPAHVGLRENLTFHDRVPEDVRAILAWTRRAFAAPIVLGGWCSGGYYAMRAAVADAPLAALVLVNPGHPDTEPYAKRYQALSHGVHYAGSVRRLSSWTKLLRGDVDVRRLARTAQRLAVGAVSARAQELARRAGIPLRGDLGSELVQLTRRGVRPIFAYSAGEAVHQLFLERAGGTPARLVAAGAMRLFEIAGPDHTFTPRWSHAVLVDALATSIAGAVP